MEYSLERRMKVKKWIFSKAIAVLALLIICSTAFAFNPMTVYAESIAINGVHTFYDSSFTYNGGDTATSNDGYFLLKGSKYKLNSDEVSAWIDDGDCTSEETVYFEVSSFGSLGSFILDSVDLGEYTDGVFNNVYIEGYANGRKIYTTASYSNPKDGIAVPNFSLDFTEAEGKTIDAFRIYYTRGAGLGFAHSDFNIYSFTISSASTEPVPDTIAPNPVTNVTCTDNDTTSGVDGRDFTVGFDDSTDDSIDVSSYDIYIYKDGEEPADKGAMDLLSASNKVAIKTINRTSGDDGADTSLGSGVITDSKGQQLTAGDYWVIITAKDSAGNYSFAKTAVKTSVANDTSVTLSVLNSTLDENTGATTIEATLSGALSQDVTVNLGFSGTALDGTDYIASDNKIVIQAGETTGSITLTSKDDSDYELDETIIVDITSVTGAAENGTQQVTVTITDNDAEPKVTLSANKTSFSEALETNQVTATLSNKSYQDITVEFGFTGTAVNGTDYSVTPVNSPVTIVIPAGSLSGSLTLRAINDDTYEGDEPFSVEITNVTNATEDGEQKVDLSIIDNETAPSVTLSVSTSAFPEKGGTATVTATLSNRSYEDVTVNLNFTGTATGTDTGTDTDIDYTASTTTLTIPAGSLSGSLTLEARDDDSDEYPLYEGDETVIVDIDSVTNGSEDGIQQVIATITDDESIPVVELSISAPSLAENGGYVIVRGTLSGRSSKDVTVYVNFLGTATKDSDYKSTVNYINISAGSDSNTCKITGLDDTAYELPETVIVSISNVSGGVVGATQQVSATITDNDVAPKVTLSSDKTSLSEALGTDEVKVTATLSNKSYQDVTVEIGLTGTAIAEIDYSVTPVNSPVTIVIPAGSFTGTLTLTVLNDALYEGDEPFSVEILNVTNGTEDGTQKVDLSVADNETAPLVTLSVAPIAFSESGGTATVTATLSNMSYQAVTVDLSFTGTATETDYTASGTTITIPAGSYSNSITLTGKNDTDYEGDETIIGDISSVTNGTENGTQQVTTTITDDDPAPSVTLSIADSTLAEDGGVATITGTLSGLSTNETKIELSFSGTASTTDYNKSLGGVIIIPAGSLSGTLTLTGIDDVTDEEDETIIVKITNITGATENGTQQLTATITDDDAEPTISIAGATVAEGDSGTANHVYTVKLSQASGKTVTVDCATKDGTATIADNDYTAKTTTLTFNPGETIKTFTVLVNGDTVLEANETVLVKLSNPTNASITAGEDTGIGTITNDDTSSISINDVSVAEDSASMNFTVILSKPSTCNVTVDYATSSGTATAGTDYITNNGTITFAPGETSKTLTIVINADLIDEEDETLYVDLSGAISGIIITDAQGIGTITDDDAAPTISIGDATVTEGNSGTTNAEFTVSLSAASGKTITVNYATANGTAIAGTDYTSKNENLIFNPGETRKIISIQVSGNTLDEDDKSFQVNLSGASNATILDASALGTITDDDDAPTISIGVATVKEGDVGTANLVYTVTLTKASGKTVTVDCATQDGTATIADHDYTAKTTTLIFNPGETSKTITVLVNGDTVLEVDETVLVILSNPTNASFAAGHNTGTGTITNDDKPVIEVYGNSEKIANNDTTPSITDYTDFGSIKVEGEPVIREFTIKNNGNTTLVLSGTSPYITVSGENAIDFSVVTGPAISLKNGETTSFSVKFDPSSSGKKTAKIIIANNDDSNNPFIFDIQGEGTTPPTSPTPPISTPTPTPTPTQGDNKIDVIFGDDTQKAATAKISEKDGIKTTVVTFDDVAVNENLDKMGENKPNEKTNTIKISVSNNSDIVIGQLNGQTVKNMQDRDVILEIKTDNAIYTIPAKDINIDSVSKDIGSQIKLQDIKVNISISKSTKETEAIVENSARKNNYQLVVKPVDFEITCTSGSKTINLFKFNNYVERTVILPEGIDGKRITTGVLLNKDGTFSHVPTAVKLVDGKYYAKINSLTNSTYTLIWNPVTFKDAKKHWSKNYVNSVGSRLIDDGVGNSNFAPNRAITRAELASMIVKALGLKGTNFEEKFKDVKTSDPSYYYIYTVYEYGIMGGYSNGNFGPEDLVTREQAMRILVKAMDVAGVDVKVSKTDIEKQLVQFKDSSKISSGARKAAAICVKNGIFAGNKQGSLNPKGNLTRGESATVIIKLLKKAGLI